MSKILHDETKMPNKIVADDNDMAAQIPSYAATLLNIFDEGTSKMRDAFANYVAFDSQIENLDGTNPIARRLGFITTNLANLWNTQVHGNRNPFRVKMNRGVPITDKNGKQMLDHDQHGNPIFQPPTTEEMAISNIRFASTQNVAYRQEQLDKYVKEQQANGITEDIYQEDLEYQQRQVNLRSSELWHDFVNTMVFWTHIHEILTDEEFVYTPYPEKNVRTSYGSSSNIAKLAATLRKPKTE